jgi:GlpG protein
VKQGEVWRLVTPIFIHFGVMHLVFNMLMLYSLGRLIEGRRGTLIFALMVLALAVSSNLAEYYLARSFKEGRWALRGSPQFGGMSGVLYGLFGYLWMKGRYDPASGLGVDRTTVLIMLGWFVLCLTGLMGPIANVAHAAGLLGGVLLGLASAFLGRRLRKRG